MAASRQPGPGPACGRRACSFLHRCARPASTAGSACAAQRSRSPRQRGWRCPGCLRARSWRTHPTAPGPGPAAIRSGPHSHRGRAADTRATRPGAGARTGFADGHSTAAIAAIAGPESYPAPGPGSAHRPPAPGPASAGCRGRQVGNGQGHGRHCRPAVAGLLAAGGKTAQVQVPLKPGSGHGGQASQRGTRVAARGLGQGLGRDAAQLRNHIRNACQLGRRVAALAWPARCPAVV